MDEDERQSGDDDSARESSEVDALDELTRSVLLSKSIVDPICYCCKELWNDELWHAHYQEPRVQCATCLEWYCVMCAEVDIPQTRSMRGHIGHCVVCRPQLKKKRVLMACCWERKLEQHGLL